jgi:hypothetical protein
MRETVGVFFLIAFVGLSCATEKLTKVEKTYFSHLYYGMYDEFKESEDICHVHKVVTVERIVKSYGGMAIDPDEEYKKARVRQFPNSFLCAYTGYCTSGDWELIRNVCPKCRSAEIQWLKSHGRPVDEEEEKPLKTQ